LRPLLALFFSFRIPRPPSSTLFPYTTLFRSDLADPESTRPEVGEREVALRVGRGPRLISVRLAVVVQVAVDDPAGDARPPVAVRSEEHTSELQSLTNLVCRLLLEKKTLMTRH